MKVPLTIFQVQEMLKIFLAPFSSLTQKSYYAIRLGTYNSKKGEFFITFQALFFR